MYYSQSTLNAMKKRLIVLRSIMYSLLGIAIVLTVVSLILMKEENETFFKVFLSIADTVLILAFAFIVSFLVSGVKTEITHVETINKCDEETIHAIIVSISKNIITLPSDIAVFEVLVNVDGSNRTIKVHYSLLDDSLTEGKEYELVLGNSYLKEWKAL